MTLALRFIAATDVGRIRKNNEDSAYAGPHLLLLADGMGGAAAGEVASAAAVQSIRDLDKQPAGEADLTGLLAESVHQANVRVAQLIREDPRRDGMGTTLTALLFDGARLAMAHLGDSRAYRLRAGELTVLSHDHTFVQALVDEGRISAEEAFSHPHRNLILRVLDGREGTEPDLQMLDVAAGDRYLLCSDGIPDYLTADQIRELLAADTVEAAALDLIVAALEAKSNDNVTCVVADVVDGEDTAASSQLASKPAEPILIGAASELGQGGTGPAHTAELPAIDHRTGNREPTETTAGTAEANGSGGSTTGAEEEEEEEEELRYAGRARWIKRLVAVAAVLAVLAGAGVVAYRWSQRQFYVGSNGEYAAIFRGVDASVPLITVRRVHEASTVLLRHLPTYRRDQVIASIDADNLADARRIVAELRSIANQCVPPATTGPPSTPAPPRTPAIPTTPAPPTTPAASPSTPVPAVTGTLPNGGGSDCQGVIR